jgi:hypothetical protein
MPTRQIADPDIHVLVTRWLARAEELLAQADAMRDADARQTMQEIAAKYEKMAQDLERRMRRADET